MLTRRCVHRILPLNIVGQFISAVEAGAKVFWSVFLACAVVLGIEYYFPDFLEGLPSWVLPVVRFTAIVTGVLCVPSILDTLGSWLRLSSRPILSPFKVWTIRRRLRAIGVSEVAILSGALARCERSLWLNPDHPAVIKLQDQGLLSRTYLLVLTDDRASSFEIPEAVWRQLLDMREFAVSDHAQLLHALGRGTIGDEAAILAALPQAHPAVGERIKILQRSRAG